MALSYSFSSFRGNGLGVGLILFLGVTSWYNRTLIGSGSIKLIVINAVIAVME